MNEEDLVAAIVADPEDEVAWMVYADWLLERNHPRAELIQLGPAAAGGDKAAAWRIRELEADEERLVSPRLLERAKQWRFGFDRGFIKLAEFEQHAKPRVDGESFRALCVDPHAGLLDTMVIDIYEFLDDADPITRMTRRQYVRADVEDAVVELTRLRWLRTLRIHGVACNELSHPNLRDVGTDSITCRDARMQLPALHHLSWHAMSEADGFGTMLSQPLPQLRSISISRGYPSMIGELAASSFASQIEELGLVTNDLAALATLIAHATAFSQLRRLSVTGIYEELDQADVDALRRAVEQAFPSEELYIPWRDLLPDPVVEPRPGPATETVEVDHESRRPDGTIDALARWNRGH